MDFDSRKGTYQGIITIVAMLIGLGFPFLVQWESGRRIMEWIFLGIVLVAELPLMILFLKNWNKGMEQILFYENACVSQKK